MLPSNSPSFKLDIETIQRWLRTSLIVFTPAILIVLNQAQAGAFDLTAVKAAAFASLIDFVRRFIKDYSNS